MVAVDTALGRLADALGVPPETIKADTPVSLPVVAQLLDRSACTVRGMVARHEVSPPDARQSPVGRRRWWWKASTVASMIRTPNRGG